MPKDDEKIKKPVDSPVRETHAPDTDIDTRPYLKTMSGYAESIRERENSTDVYRDFSTAAQEFMNSYLALDLESEIMGSSDDIRDVFAPLLEAAKKYQQELGKKEKLSPDEIKDLFAIRQMQALDMVTAYEISPDTLWGTEMLLAGKIAFVDMLDADIHILSDPAAMERVTMSEFRGDRFNDFVKLHQTRETLNEMLGWDADRLKGVWDTYLAENWNNRRQNNPEYRRSLVQRLSSRLNLTEQNDQNYLGKKSLEELEKLAASSPQDLKSYWDKEQEKRAVIAEENKKKREKTIADRKEKEAEKELYQKEHADELKQKRERTNNSFKEKREKNLLLRKEQELLEQQEKEHLGKDEATRELLETYRAEDEKARMQMQPTEPTPTQPVDPTDPTQTQPVDPTDPTQMQLTEPTQQPQPLSAEEFTARFHQLQATMATLQKQMDDLQQLNPNRQVQQTSEQKAPEQDSPKEVPKQDSPKQEAPKEEVPKQEAPKQEAPKQESPKQKPTPKAPERPAWIKAKAQNIIRVDPFYPVINAAAKGIKNTRKVDPGLGKFMEHLKKFNKTYQTSLKNTKEQRKILGGKIGMSADDFRRELAPMLKEGKQYQSRAAMLGKDIGEAELNNLAVITQLETMDTLAANNIAPDSREGLGILLASRMTFEINRLELNRDLEKNKKNPRNESYRAKLEHMCHPKKMQLNMRNMHKNPNFRNVIEHMDEKQMQDLLNKPSSELKQVFYDGYVKQSEPTKTDKVTQAKSPMVEQKTSKVIRL